MSRLTVRRSFYLPGTSSPGPPYTVARGGPSAAAQLRPEARLPRSLRRARSASSRCGSQPDARFAALTRPDSCALIWWSSKISRWRSRCSCFSGSFLSAQQAARTPRREKRGHFVLRSSSRSSSSIRPSGSTSGTRRRRTSPAAPSTTKRARSCSGRPRRRSSARTARWGTRLRAAGVRRLPAVARHEAVLGRHAPGEARVRRRPGERLEAQSRLRGRPLDVRPRAPAAKSRCRARTTR